MITDTQRLEMYEALVGRRNLDYYLQVFKDFDERGGGLIPSWNWAAFLFSVPWALYRKIYPVFFAVIGGVVLWAVLVVHLGVSPLINNLFYVVSWAAFGLYGNALYYRHVTRKIESARAEDGDSARQLLEVGFKGGVQLWVIPVFVLGPFLAGFAAGIFIPAYQDNAIRAQVSLGLNRASEVTMAVETEYERTGRFPADNRAAGLPLPAEITDTYVSGITVNGGLIEIRYGNSAQERIHGRAVILIPQVQPDGSLDWVCGSENIHPVHLPAVCRQPF